VGRVVLGSPCGARPGTNPSPTGVHSRTVRIVFNPLGFLLVGVAIGYVLVRSLDRLPGRDVRNEIGVDFPPGSEAEREWRLRVSGLEGTSPTAL